jgi:peptide/nickel transport system ATP-binding protein
MRYLPRNGRIVGGQVMVDGQDVTKMSEARLREFRSREASMVYQDPALAMNPTIRVGKQLIESFTLLGQSKTQAEASALEALRKVRIADPQRVMDRFPFQLSGGMQQRVVIAMALACDPKLLVLDEPTTGLDATVEAEVLDLVQVLRKESDAAVLLIAHNLGIIRSLCDRVGVMYAGRIVEEGRSAEVFDHPQHPYTVGLLRSLPRHGARKTEKALATIPGLLPLIGSDLPTCVFLDRCPLADDTCRTQVPPVTAVGEGRWTRCHHVERVADIEEAVPALGITVLAESTEQAGVLELSHVSKTFKQRNQAIPALVDVDLQLVEGETLGIVGESGSGKSTLAKTMLGIESLDSGGSVSLSGHSLAASTMDRSADDKRSMQMIFQNPDSALNRSWSVRRILVRSVEKLTGIKGKEANDRVEALAAHLRLTPRHLDLKPRQLSGGLKQRVAIARAFAGDPRIVVCDEPTSALDVSVQAAILNLLSDLQVENRTSYVFISHDMGVVRYLADRIAVMYLGRIQEIGPTDAIFNGPNHPYTEALLSAIPSVDGEERARIRLGGEIPSPANPPSGCVFHPRCPRAIEGVCSATEPPLREIAPGHQMRCHIPAEQLVELQRRG